MRTYFDLRKNHQEAVWELSDAYQVQALSNQTYQERLFELQTAHQDELEQVLGSDVAVRIHAEADRQTQNLRRQLREVELTDDEFAQIAKVMQDTQRAQQQVNLTRQRAGASREELRTRQESIEQEKKDRLDAVLGPD